MTERLPRRSEEGRRSEDRFRSLFDECPVSLWEGDITGLLARLEQLRDQGVDLSALLSEHRGEVNRCIRLIRVHAVNRAAVELHGAPDQKSLFENLAAVFTKESLTAFRKIMIALAEGERQFATEAVVRTLGGKKLAVNLRWSLLPDREGGYTRALMSVEDLTEQKSALATLRETERNFREFVLAQPDPLQVLSPDGTILVCNESSAAAYGSTAAEMTGRNAFDGMPPDVAADRRALLERVIAGRQRLVFEEQFRDRFYETILSPILDPSGEVGKIAVFPHDITDHRETEEKLRRSEEFVRGILDTVDEGFLVVAPDYRILTANRGYCHQVGMETGEVVGRHCHEVSHRLQVPCFEAGEECAVRSALETGTPATALHRHPDPDGGVLFVETKAFPLRDDEGRIVAAILTITNITEKHLLEEERLKTQKLESIGTLAGGIAHDFNNLLQGIFGYISLAKINLGRNEKSLAMLEEAEKALNLTVNLTSQLLTFSRGGKPVKRRTALGPVIGSAARFALSGSHTDCRFDIGPDLWPADADEGQIAQVIQNVVLNADQAMPLGGLVTISARNLAADRAGSRPGFEARDYVEIAIRDQGVGIPEAHLPRIFDPYFTTKERGSGLGLATTYSIVRNHDGRIEAKSTAGKGSTFVICIPAVPATVEQCELPAVRTATRAGRILIMDDDEVVRTIAGELLRGLGHEVEFAEHGEAAIGKYREARDAGRLFDAVILDLTIRGGIGGAETVRRLLAIDPGVKAIVSSGYSDDSVTADYVQHGFRAFLKKPYDAEDLRSALDALLV